MTRLKGLGAAGLLGLAALAGGCKDDGVLDRNEGPVEETRESVDKQADKAGDKAKDARKDAEKGVGGAGDRAGDEAPKK